MVMPQNIVAIPFINVMIFVMLKKSKYAERIASIMDATLNPRGRRLTSPRLFRLFHEDCEGPQAATCHLCTYAIFRRSTWTKPTSVVSTYHLSSYSYHTHIILISYSYQVKKNGKLFPGRSPRRFFVSDREILHTSCMSPEEDLT